MTKETDRNRTLVVLAEGDTERAAREHIKRFLDARAAGRPKVRLQTSLFDGALRPGEVRGRAEKYLADPAVLGVIALVDLYPQFKDVEEANRTVASWLPADTRCHVHVAKHDFEAWLLVGWDAILKQSGIKSALKPFGPQPENVNHGKPPAHRLWELFQRGKPPRKYKKPVDGKKLFEQLELEAVAAACPEFKRFLNTLLRLAGYGILP